MRACLLWLLLPVTTWAAEYRAADVNDLKRLEKRLQPGDRVVLANGEWRDAELKLTAIGTAEQPVTFAAETPGQVILCGSSRVLLSGRFVTLSGLYFRGVTTAKDLLSFRRDTDAPAHDCRVTECAFVDCNSPEDKGYRWVSFYGERNRLDHCYLAGKRRGSATVGVWLASGGGEHRIDHNHFGHRPALGENGGETIQLGDSSTFTHSCRTTVDTNLFEACNGEAEIITNKSCDNRYLHNTFLRCDGALTLRAGDRCRVEGNFFLGQATRRTGGVRVIGEDHVIVNNYFDDLRGEEIRAGICFMNGIPNSPPEGYRQVKRVLVAFNTWANCAQPVYVGYPGKSSATLPPSEVTFANNVVWGTQSPLFAVRTPPVEWRVLGNLVQGGEPGEHFRDGVRRLDPGLQLDDTTNLWRCVESSAVRGQATGEFPLVTLDIDGDLRPAHASDVGCDQFVVNSLRRRPLTAQDVGPGWLSRKERASPTTGQ